MISVGRYLERATAVGSFLTAAALAFTSLLISDEHDIAAGVCMVIAQFLLLTASIFGIDYKLYSVSTLTAFHHKKPASDESDPPRPSQQ